MKAAATTTTTTTDATQVVQEFNGPYLRVEGFEKPLLNMANFDFLGMGQRKELKEAAVLALDKVYLPDVYHLTCMRCPARSCTYETVCVDALMYCRLNVSENTKRGACVVPQVPALYTALAL